MRAKRVRFFKLGFKPCSLGDPWSTMAPPHRGIQAWTKELKLAQSTSKMWRFYVQIVIMVMSERRTRAKRTEGIKSKWRAKCRAKNVFKTFAHRMRAKRAANLGGLWFSKLEHWVKTWWGAVWQDWGRCSGRHLYRGAKLTGQKHRHKLWNLFHDIKRKYFTAPLHKKRRATEWISCCGRHLQRVYKLTVKKGTKTLTIWNVVHFVI